MPGAKATIKQLILCILAEAGERKRVWEKNELIMHIYMVARRRGHRLKISTIDRYLRDFAALRLLGRSEGRSGVLYYPILYNIRRSTGGDCSGVWVDGQDSTRPSRVPSGLLNYI